MTAATAAPTITIALAKVVEAALTETVKGLVLVELVNPHDAAELYLASATAPAGELEAGQ